MKLKSTTSGHILLGACVAKQGRFSEAKAHQRRAIDLATPGHAVDEAHLNLGLVLRAEGRYKTAEMHFAKALQLDPKYRAAREGLRDVRGALKLANNERHRKRPAQSKKRRR